MNQFHKQFTFIIIIAIVFSIGVYVAIAVNNRGAAPVAYWKFDEGYGTTAYDAAGSNDGTITNAQWRNEEDCKVGKCLYFDGDGDYVEVPDDDSLDITDAITIEAWVKPAKWSSGDATYGIIEKKGGDSYDWVLRKGWVNDTISLRVGNDEVESTTHLEAGIYYHIVATVQNNIAKMYVNGIKENEGSVTLQGGENIYIGAYWHEGVFKSDRYFHGFIDDVRIYDYARTPAQIRADYLAGAGSRGASVMISNKSSIQDQSQGLVGHWKMDETSWTVDCSADTVMDSSGAGNHGKACPNAGGLAPSAGKFGNSGLFDGTEDYVDVGDIDF